VLDFGGPSLEGTEEGDGGQYSDWVFIPVLWGRNAAGLSSSPA